MDEQIPTPALPTKHRNAVPLIVILIVIILGLGGALLWALFFKGGSAPSGGSSSTGSSSTSTAAAGPCTGGTTNPAPTGYTFYESADYGFKFAYPTAWGTPVVTTTPVGGVSGHYLSGHFSSNDSVTFGGNATDYVVGGRDGAPLDNPGYLEATGKFYTVQIWTYHAGGGVADEPKYDLFPITEATTLQNGCNAKAAVTKYGKSEISDAYDVARFNLQPASAYYGVNFVLKNPDASKRTDFEKLISTFQLVP